LCGQEHGNNQEASDDSGQLGGQSKEMVADVIDAAVPQLRFLQARAGCARF
jgi:hypothetical protein